MDREAIEEMLETMLIGDSDQRKLRRLLVEQERERQRLKIENEWLKKVLEDCEKKRVDTEGRYIIDMTIPQPCTRFRNAGTVEWIAKLMEETNEAIQEAKKVYVLEKADADGVEYAGCIGDAEVTLAEELTDVITVCVSWLHALGYDEYLRSEVQKRINEKNHRRGYW